MYVCLQKPANKLKVHINGIISIDDNSAVILFEIQPLFDTGRPPDSIHQSYFASFKVVLTSLSSLVILITSQG